MVEQSGSNLTFQPSQQGIGFSGLITFTGSTHFQTEISTIDPLQAVDIGSSKLTIDGGRIQTGTISAAKCKYFR